jgi:hypothetical protein
MHPESRRGQRGAPGCLVDQELHAHGSPELSKDVSGRPVVRVVLRAGFTDIDAKGLDLSMTAQAGFLDDDGPHVAEDASVSAGAHRHMLGRLAQGSRLEKPGKLLQDRALMVVGFIERISPA